MTKQSHKPRKRFGQNFLHEGGIIEKIVSSIAPKEDDLMVEIGPGQGALTKPLLSTLNTIHAIELDRDLIPFLKAELEPKGLTLHESDALKFDFRQLFSEDKKLRVVGNLPYNISTPLIFHLLSYQDDIADMHFMLQEEVVDRLAAEPGNKAYGKLSVITQYFCEVHKLFTVPPGAFNPPPKVMSAIVRLAPRRFHLEAKNLELFEHVVKISFAQRRKTLRNNLKQLMTSEQIDQLTQDCSLRPEQLSLEDFINLANDIESMGIKP